MGGTWDRDPDGFLLRVLFLFLRRTCPCRLVPLPPLECFPFLPLVAAVLITPKGAESPDSGRIGMIGALGFFFYLRPFRINFTLPGRPSSALRH